jgi:hypothetical protein
VKKSKSLNARPKDTAVVDGKPDPPTASPAGKLTSAHGLAAFVAVFIAAVRQPKIQDREDLLKPPP